MSNVDPPKSHDTFKVSDLDIEGLEPFDEQTPAEQAPHPTPQPPLPADSPPRPAQPAPDARAAPRHMHRRRSVSVFWPIVLIMIGALLLLQNLGYVSGLSWGTAWRLWPLLLIALGIDTLFARRSALGALLSALLILTLLGGAIYMLLHASSVPWLAQLLQERDWQRAEIAYPLAGVEQARVEIDWDSVPLRLEVLDDSPHLIEGTVVYRGQLNWDTSGGRRATVRLSTTSMGAGWSPGSWSESVQPEGQKLRWTLGLSPRVPLDLELDGGSGAAEVDLRGLDLDGLQLDVASGAVDLYLPGGKYEARIEGGSGSLDLWLPPEAGVRLVVDGGSGALRPGERLRLVEGQRDGDGVWETANGRQADSTLSIWLDIASGTVRVQDWE